MTPVSQNSLPGEPPGDKLARLVRSFAGCSLSHRADELGALVARGVDDPKRAVTIKTNCGMFALGIFALAGVDDDQLGKPYLDDHGLAPGANAIAWLRAIGQRKKALVRYTGQTGMQPKVGSLVRYNTAGKNDDHVEFLLSTIDVRGCALHGGGGRPNNEITVSNAPAVVTFSAGRPLVEFWDPDLLGIEIVRPGSDINEAIP